MARAARSASFTSTICCVSALCKGRRRWLDDKPHVLDALDLYPFPFGLVGALDLPPCALDRQFATAVGDRLVEHVGLPDIGLHALVEIGPVASRHLLRPEPMAGGEHEDHREQRKQHKLDLPAKIDG